MKLLNLELFYIIAGGFLLLVAGRIAFDPTAGKRVGPALFWGLLAVIFWRGKHCRQWWLVIWFHSW